MVPSAPIIVLIMCHPLCSIKHNFHLIIKMFERAFANNLKQALCYDNFIFKAFFSVFVSSLRCIGLLNVRPWTQLQAWMDLRLKDASRITVLAGP